MAFICALRRSIVRWNSMTGCIAQWLELALVSGTQPMQLFPCCRVLRLSTWEKDMNTNLIRTNGAVFECWPVLLAYSAYMIWFCTFAATVTSVFLVA